MRCPFCGHLEDKVVDSRQSKDGAAIRRRRECLDCGRRFTSYEHIEEVFPQIVKRDGTREDYDRQKIVQGVRIACKKLPISRIQIDAVVDEVERGLLEQQAREVSSEWVGARVTEGLRNLDPVAYIRFASVYRAFGDIQEFLRELRDLESSPETTPKDSDDDI
ncbi:MAG: transcriptional regulator NrdR [bacterium]